MKECDLGVSLPGRRSGGELSSAQAALLLQEETLRRAEQERRALRDKVAALERSLQAAQVGIATALGTIPAPSPAL